MVDQSERAFRQLVRSRGVDLCYSPMLLAKQVVNEASYRARYVRDDLGQDECFVQLGGSEVQDVVGAARLILSLAPRTLCIDVNLGCPQSCARRGGFGAFLDHDKACEIVYALALFCRVSCKIRAQHTPHETANLARKLVDHGASCIAIHARTREQRSCGAACAETIRKVVCGVGVPVVANGNVRTAADAEALLSATGAAAVMSAEALLAVPSLFLGRPESRRDLALEYLELAQNYGTPLSWVLAHLAAILKLDPPPECINLEAALTWTLRTAEDRPASPPTRRDLMTQGELKAAERRRIDRHRFKAALLRQQGIQCIRAPKAPTAAALDAAARGHILLCAGCGNPAKRTCVHAACRACCRMRCTGDGDCPCVVDCGNHQPKRRKTR